MVKPPTGDSRAWTYYWRVKEVAEAFVLLALGAAALGMLYVTLTVPKQVNSMSKSLNSSLSDNSKTLAALTAKLGNLADAGTSTLNEARGEISDLRAVTRRGATLVSNADDRLNGPGGTLPELNARLSQLDKPIGNLSRAADNLAQASGTVALNLPVTLHNMNVATAALAGQSPTIMANLSSTTGSMAAITAHGNVIMGQWEDVSTRTYKSLTATVTWPKRVGRKVLSGVKWLTNGANLARAFGWL